MTNELATPAPDLVILLVATYRTVIERLLSELNTAGMRGVRPIHGFVIRAVAAEQPTNNRLAELLDTSKQAASKLAESMVAAGFLARFKDPNDRRLIRLRLAAKGTRVRDRALLTSAALEDELRRSIGAQGLATFRKGLMAMLEQSGALEDVLAHRAHPVW